MRVYSDLQRFFTGDAEDLRELTMYQRPPQDFDSRFCTSLVSKKHIDDFLKCEQLRKNSERKASLVEAKNAEIQNLFCSKCKKSMISRPHRTPFRHPDPRSDGGTTLLVVATTGSNGGQLQTWHLECFECVHCLRPFVDFLFYPVSRSLIYCARHYSELLRGRCFACEELIFHNDCQTMGGKIFHKEHVICTECNCAITTAGQLIILEEHEVLDRRRIRNLRRGHCSQDCCQPDKIDPVSRLCCTACYRRRYKKICSSCTLTISGGDFIFCCGRYLHDTPACRRCGVCGIFRRKREHDEALENQSNSAARNFYLKVNASSQHQSLAVSHSRVNHSTSDNNVYSKFREDEILSFQPSKSCEESTERPISRRQEKRNINFFPPPLADSCSTSNEAEHLTSIHSTTQYLRETLDINSNLLYEDFRPLPNRRSKSAAAPLTSPSNRFEITQSLHQVSKIPAATDEPASTTTTTTFSARQKPTSGRFFAPITADSSSLSITQSQPHSTSSNYDEFPATGDPQNETLILESSATRVDPASTSTMMSPPITPDEDEEIPSTKETQSSEGTSSQQGGHSSINSMSSIANLVKSSLEATRLGTSSTSLIFPPRNQSSLRKRLRSVAKKLIFS